MIPQPGGATEGSGETARCYVPRWQQSKTCWQSCLVWAFVFPRQTLCRSATLLITMGTSAQECLYGVQRPLSPCCPAPSVAVEFKNDLKFSKLTPLSNKTMSPVQAKQHVAREWVVRCRQAQQQPITEARLAELQTLVEAGAGVGLQMPELDQLQADVGAVHWTATVGKALAALEAHPAGSRQPGSAGPSRARHEPEARPAAAGPSGGQAQAGSEAVDIRPPPWPAAVHQPQQQAPSAELASNPVPHLAATEPSGSATSPLLSSVETLPAWAQASPAAQSAAQHPPAQQPACQLSAAAGLAEHQQPVPEPNGTAATALLDLHNAASLVKQGRKLPVDSGLLEQLTVLVVQAEEWEEQVSCLQLMEASQQPVAFTSYCSERFAAQPTPSDSQDPFPCAWHESSTMRSLQHCAYAFRPGSPSPTGTPLSLRADVTQQLHHPALHLCLQVGQILGDVTVHGTPPPDASSAEMRRLISEGQAIQLQLPSLEKLEAALEGQQIWEERLEHILEGKNHSLAPVHMPAL